MKGFSIISVILIILQYFYIKPISSSPQLRTFSEKNCDHSCFSVVAEILHVAHAFHSIGQVLVSQEWFQSVNQLHLKGFRRESGIPWLVYGRSPVIKNATAVSIFSSSTDFQLISSNKFTSSKFAHLHHSLYLSNSSSPQFFNAQRQQTWRKLLYLTFRQGMRINYSEFYGSTSDSASRKAGLSAAWNAFIQKDLFIVTFDLVQLLNSVTSKANTNDNDLILSRTRQMHSISRHTIWIGCSHSNDDINSTTSSTPNYNSSSDVLSIEHNSKQLCIYSSRKGFTYLLGHISHCKDSSLTMHIDKFHQLLVDHSIGGDGTRYASSPIKRRVNDMSYVDHEEQDLSSGITRRKIDPLSRKGFLYSSLVFITKKLPESNTTSNAWGPFTIASWIGILAAYTMTAIVFALIKIITMNNLENSWYECVFHHLLTFMNENKVTMSRQREVINTISSSTIGIDVIDKNHNYGAMQHSNKNCQSSRTFLQVTYGSGKAGPRFLETRRISVKSVTVPISNNNTLFAEKQRTFVKIKCNQTRGKLSRTILYGTIRLVSFVLLAMYEGKLYNTITFPKSKLVATFDELISNDKYFIKVSSEAAKFENITARIKGNLTFEDSPAGLLSTTKVSSNDGDSNSNSNNGKWNSPHSTHNGKFVESVNIFDCVNWVESGPDTNHACVGYEFELRNLHKTQKSDKILVRSKHRLLRFGSAGATSVIVTGSSAATSARFMSRRRGFTLFPGGLQISKWILESGILQLWSIVENAFMESVINPNWKDPFKVFTIRDYLGLFVVYSMLLILASIMFLLEHIVKMLKTVAKNKKVRKFVKSTWNKCKILTKGWQLCVKCNNFSLCSCCCFWDRIQYRNGEMSNVDNWRGRKYFRGCSEMNGSAA